MDWIGVQLGCNHTFAMNNTVLIPASRSNGKISKRRAFTGQRHGDGLLATIAFHEQSVGGINRQRDDAQCSILPCHADDGGQQELERFTPLVPLKRTFESLRPEGWVCLFVGWARDFKLCIYIYILHIYIYNYIYIILYYIILYYIILYHIISYYIISYHIILYCTVLYYIILYYIVLYYIILYYIILYYIYWYILVYIGIYWYILICILYIFIVMYIQWRPLVTSTFWVQHNSYAGKSMRPLHIMVTSTMPNRLGDAVNV